MPRRKFQHEPRTREWKLEHTKIYTLLVHKYKLYNARKGPAVGVAVPTALRFCLDVTEGCYSCNLQECSLRGWGDMSTRFSRERSVLSRTSVFAMVCRDWSGDRTTRGMGCSALLLRSLSVIGEYEFEHAIRYADTDSGAAPRETFVVSVLQTQQFLQREPCFLTSRSHASPTETAMAVALPRARAASRRLAASQDSRLASKRDGSMSVAQATLLPASPCRRQSVVRPWVPSIAASTSTAWRSPSSLP